MKYIKYSVFLLLINSICLIALAQDQTGSTSAQQKPENVQIIPDKVFETGIPLLAIFIFLNILITFLRHRAEHKLKLRMIEKGVSDETLVKIFKESNAIMKLQPLKWFLFSFALGISFVCINLFRNYFSSHSAYLPVGIIILFFSIASFIYYRVLSKQTK